MRRALPLVVLLLWSAAMPAEAEPRARGGTSFDTAPVLEPGRYRDEVAAGETLFYAVHASERQQLSVAVNIHPRGRVPQVAAHLRLYNRDRREDIFAHEPALIGNHDKALHTSSAIVGDSLDFPRPGRQYFSLSMEFVGAPAAGAYDLELRVGLQQAHGPKILAPGPRGGPPPRHPASPGGVPLYLGAFLGGLVIGALVITVRLALRTSPRELKGL